MLKNYFKTTLRALFKHKSYTFINIFGLAVGFAAFLLILVHVQYQLSFDRFHSNSDRIYQVTRYIQNILTTSSEVASELEVGFTPYPIAEIISNEIPEAEQVVRLHEYSQEELVVYEDQSFYEGNIYHGDPNIFEVFDFEVTSGNPKETLDAPFTVFLSESIAQKYFRGESAVGKDMSIGTTDPRNYEVAGTFKDLPQNSSIQFNFLISSQTRVALNNEIADNWNSGSTTYILLREQASPEDLEASLKRLAGKYEETSNISRYGLLPLTDTYLHGKERLKVARGGNIESIYLFLTIAVLIVIMAGINYTNLATARSAPRAGEVGIRKVAGADRSQLIIQFLSESLILSFIAIALGIMLTELSLPYFITFTGHNLSLDLLQNIPLLLLIVGTGILVAFLAGLYPALMLSGFKPTHVLKGNLPVIGSWNRIRKGLVVFQFIISTVLILATIVVKNQLHFIQNKDLGFDKEHVVNLPINDIPELQPDVLKNAFLGYNNIKNVSLSTTIPGETFGIWPVSTDQVEAYNGSVDGRIVFQLFSVDEDYLETMDMSIKEGRALSTEFSTDRSEALVLNEAAVEKLGWTDPIGKTITFGSTKRTVVGILKDFNFSTLKSDIEPIMMTLSTNSPRYVSIRIKEGAIFEAMDYIRETWAQITPTYPFIYEFLDDKFDAMYREEQKQGQLFWGFCILAVFIAGLGLFGLSAYTTEQRTKEIGIRKVLGATVSNIVALLSKDFIKLVAIGFLLAAPIAWYAMNQWLADFVYRIEIGPEIFVLAGGAVLLITFLTVSWQSIRAAIANPVDSLRSK